MVRAAPGNVGHFTLHSVHLLWALWETLGIQILHTTLTTEVRTHSSQFTITYLISAILQPHRIVRGLPLWSFELYSTSIWAQDVKKAREPHSWRDVGWLRPHRFLEWGFARVQSEYAYANTANIHWWTFGRNIIAYTPKVEVYEISSLKTSKQCSW